MRGDHIPFLPPHHITCEGGGQAGRSARGRESRSKGTGWGNSSGGEELAEMLLGDVSRQVRVRNTGQAGGVAVPGDGSYCEFTPSRGISGFSLSYAVNRFRAISLPRVNFACVSACSVLSNSL